jgi:hypothetical protein
MKSDDGIKGGLGSKARFYVPAVLGGPRIARAAGVKPEAVKHWLDRRRRQGWLGYKKVGGRNMIRIDVAEEYLRLRGLERRSKRPPGYTSLKALAVEAGMSLSAMHKAARRKKLCIVNVKNRFYVQPEDAANFLLEMKSNKPLAGWVMASELGRRTGRSKEAVNQWIRRHKIKTRLYLHPSIGRPTPYLSEVDAERYKRVAKETAKHIGIIHRKKDLVLDK